MSARPSKKQAKAGAVVPSQRTVGRRVALWTLAASVALAAIKIVPDSLKALASPAPPEGKAAATGAMSGVTVSGNNHLLNTGTQIVNIGDKKEQLIVRGQAEYVTLEPLTKEDGIRGKTVTAKGFGGSASSEERYTLPDGAYDVEHRAFWNIEGKDTSAESRRDGNQIIATGRIRSHPFDGARVWGELFIAVKFKVSVVKPGGTQTLEARPFESNQIVWNVGTGVLRAATLEVLDHAGAIKETIRVERDPLSQLPGQKGAAYLTADLTNNLVRVIR